jgi:O-methyltransferase domain/Dimerisation domain
MTSPAPAIQQLPFGAMSAKIVYACAELGIADLLAGGSRTSAELARRTRAHGPSLRRLLRALAGLGVVAQVEHDRFELTELGTPLRSDAPGSVRRLVMMLCGPESGRTWDELVPSVRAGECAWERAHGMAWVEFYERYPEQAETFNRAMAEHTRDAAPGIIAAADFSRFDSVLDLGGGDGTLIAEILRAEPGLEGVLCDLPAGLEAAAGTLAAAGVADRCRVAPCDFFESVPDGADAYVMKQVLHDWDDGRAAAILRNTRAAMAPDARLLIVERTLPGLVGEADAQTLLIDILMLLNTGGRERTEQEFRCLLDATGFAEVTFGDAIPPFDYRVIEAISGRTGPRSRT